MRIPAGTLDHHLNHESLGVTPRAAFKVYQGWQRELERQPVEFLWTTVLQNDWPTVLEACHLLVVEAEEQARACTGR